MSMVLPLGVMRRIESPWPTSSTRIWKVPAMLMGPGGAWGLSYVGGGGGGGGEGGVGGVVVGGVWWWGGGWGGGCVRPGGAGLEGAGEQEYPRRYADEGDDQNADNDEAAEA